MLNYAHPQSLVTTEWVEQHKDDPNVSVVEVDVDGTAYYKGHIPGAIGWNWKTQLCDTLRRDVISMTNLEKLLGKSGIGNDTTIVLYGDSNNWFAAWAFWQLKIHGHKDVRIMNGGRRKWLAEGRKLSTQIPRPKSVRYQVTGFNPRHRAFASQVEKAIKQDNSVLVDTRSPDEFTGKILGPRGLPETAQRGGHIPGAKNIPWSKTCNRDGTFKKPEQLAALFSEKGVTPEKNVITYCSIGERSSHTWFVLKHLLGYQNVSNYDGSWTEWGNLVGVDVEKGS